MMERHPSPFDASAERWPTRWIHGENTTTPCFHAYRLQFETEEDARVPIWFTGDQRFILYLDGAEIARGPERGDPFNWYVAERVLRLSPGRHQLVALVWSLDTSKAPAAQMSVRHGFLLAATDVWQDRISTGIAPWQTRPVGGMTPRIDYTNRAAFLAGCSYEFDAAQTPDFLSDTVSDDWTDAVVAHHAQERLSTYNCGDANHPLLRIADLPPMLLQRFRAPAVRHIDDSGIERTPEQPPVESARHLSGEVETWQSLFEHGKALTVPPRTRRRAILDFSEYVCAYTRLRTSGGTGARIALAWAESLFHSFEYDGVKGNRDEIEGKTFHGRADLFNCGPDDFEFPALWWNCGRYVQVSIETADEPLTIERLEFDETRYPLEREDKLETGIEDWDAIAGIMWRTLQMCAHETYMDCPYYEQLQYGGDTRIQILVTYAATRDARLPRKTLRAFASSILPNGLTQSRFPCHSTQVIPQFSLYWIAMLHDFALWRGDAAFVRELLPAARRVLDTFISGIDAEGQMHTPDGWNWVDWTVEWRITGRGPGSGHAPLDETRLSGINHLQFIYVARLAAQLERWFGETVFADRLDRIREQLMQTVRDLFWNADRKLFADTPSQNTYSQHAQCFAILSGFLDDEEKNAVLDGLTSDDTLAKATVYFMHYVFESMQACGRADLIPGQLEYWKLLRSQGFRTTIERPDPSRSDCHAWGAHPIFHMHASIAGIRPTRPGFEEYVIAPADQLPPRFASELPHPSGVLRLELVRNEDSLHVTVDAPDHTTGLFRWRGATRPLEPGKQSFTVQPA